MRNSNMVVACLRKKKVGVVESTWLSVWYVITRTFVPVVRQNACFQRSKNSTATPHQPFYNYTYTETTLKAFLDI